MAVECLERRYLYLVCTRHLMAQQWGWGFYTVWGIYGEKSPITVFAGLVSGGEGRSWLWMMTGALGSGGRWHKDRQVTFPCTANGLDKPMVLPSSEQPVTVIPSLHCPTHKSPSYVLLCETLSPLVIPQFSQPIFPAVLPCLPLAPKR